MYLRFFILPFLLLLSGCSSLLYYPDRIKYIDEKGLTHSPEQVQFESTDGNNLSAWYFKTTSAKPAKATIVFFHGNGQNISTHFASMYWILSHGYDFFIFDYPGYGASEGNPSPKNTVLAGQAALDFVKKRAPDTPLVIFGQSLGGAVALKTAIETRKKHKPCLITIDSSFRSYKSVAQGVLSQKWWTWWLQPIVHLVLSDSWAPKGEIEKLSSVPMIVIHGDADKVIAYKNGREIYEESQSTKDFWKIENGEHIRAFVDKKSYKEVHRKFLASLDKFCKK